MVMVVISFLCGGVVLGRGGVGNGGRGGGGRGMLWFWPAGGGEGKGERAFLLFFSFLFFLSLVGWLSGSWWA